MFLESCHSLLGFSIFLNVTDLTVKSRLYSVWYTGVPDPTYEGNVHKVWPSNHPMKNST